MSLDISEVSWEWRKKDFSRSSLRDKPTQFYYVLSNNGDSVTLAWECVPTYDKGLKTYPANTYPCQKHEIQRLNRERRRRLGINDNEKPVSQDTMQDIRQKLPF